MVTLLVSYLVRAILLLVLDAAAWGRVAAHTGNARGISDVCLDGEIVAAQGDQLLQMESSLRRTAADDMSSTAAAAAPPQREPVASNQDHLTDDKEHATLPSSLLASSLVPNYSALDSTAKTVGADAALPVSLLASSLDLAPKSIKETSGVKAAPAKKSAEKSAAHKATAVKARASRATVSKTAVSKGTASAAAKGATKKSPAAKVTATKSTASKAPSKAAKSKANEGTLKKTGKAGHEMRLSSKAVTGSKKSAPSDAKKLSKVAVKAKPSSHAKGRKKTKQEEKVDSSEVLETDFKKGKKFVSTGATRLRQHAEPAASKTKRSNSPAHARGAENGAAPAKAVAIANENTKAKKAKKLTLTKTSKLHGKLKAASVKSKKSKEEAEEDLEDEAEEDLEDEAEAKDASTGTLFNPVIGSVVVLMSAPAGMLLLSFGAFLWVRSQDDAEMGGG